MDGVEYEIAGVKQEVNAEKCEKQVKNKLNKKWP